MSDGEECGEKRDAGAPQVTSQQAGSIRKNDFLVIKGRPCKVTEITITKTGKDGAERFHFIGIDIFIGKKLEDLVPSSHNCDVPHVSRGEYKLIGMDDGFEQKFVIALIMMVPDFLFARTG
ncbi:unnamed protein product [Cuscuta epithymum]|uniref:Eukaryotic translation initiation factor 5A n=1 Tax=Cuscuta epithymum TaxID=186058 RepID=A0AAV0GAL3_9ASTE|nr:unnamed protein product [Cuscuta epithymum]